MNERYNNAVEYADKLVDINEKYVCKENNKADSEIAYSNLLLGMPGLKVEVIPGTGHNYQIVLDSMHKYKNSHPEAPMSTRFEDGIEFIIRYSGTMELINLAYNYIAYQLEKESSGTATFTANNEELLKKLASQIEEERSTLELEAMNLDDWIHQRNTKLSEKYGYHL